MTLESRMQRNIGIFKNKNELTKEEVWRNFELMTYLIASKELELEKMDHYIETAFKMVEP